ncbi:hypothetical protein [Pseudomonas sp. RL_5y_Pfl2_69]|uniref:hypothetical protein n=1 Tax=Pseudomonas sp. RL_5y_Pfl2_69 TaxID=3088711 RepID=UPI0030D8BF84
MSLDRSQLINTARSGLAGLGRRQLGVPLLLLAMMMLPVPLFLANRSLTAGNVTAVSIFTLACP